MNKKFKFVAAMTLSLIGWGCIPPLELHKETVANIDEGSRFHLYSLDANMLIDDPTYSGILGETFYNCLKSAKKKWSPGGGDKRFAMQILGNNRKLYHYQVTTNKGKFTSMYRMKKVHTNGGYSGGGTTIKLNCSFSDFKEMRKVKN